MPDLTARYGRMASLERTRLYLSQFFSERCKAGLEEAPVHLYLLLAHAPHFASTLPLQMGPHPRQSGELVLSGSIFNLECRKAVSN